MLPTPTFELAIPSIHDGTLLECRVYHPPYSLNASAQRSLSRRCAGGAIVAHPYAPLGGSFDDPIVALAAVQLLEVSFVVVTFNFRGVSKTRTSLTGSAEINDYVSVAGFLATYLTHLSRSVKDFDLYSKDGRGLKLVFAGYSYGALVTSCLPTLEEIQRDVSQAREGQRGYEIETDAKSTAEKFKSLLIGVEPATAAIEAIKFETSYLLISPVRPPVSTFLALTHSTGNDKNLTEKKTLVIYGDGDAFNLRNGVQKWVESLHSNDHQGKIRREEVEGAGHFWKEQGATNKLRTKIREWILEELCPDDPG